jgi:heme-degrading monooxygenase HmoA
MYAAMVTVVIDDGKEDEALEGLKSQVVPMVKGMPGFVAGYWVHPQNNKGFSFVVWDTEEHARAAAPPAGTRPPGSLVTVDAVEFVEVAAST